MRAKQARLVLLMTGFIAMHRAALDHPLLKTGERFRAWFWLVCNARWKPTPYDINGKIVMLERGQLCVSLRQLGDKWGWSKSSVERFLIRLETETMIERKAGHGRMVITICNYNDYQDAAEGKRDSSGTVSGTAAGQQRDIKEEGNKEIKKKDTPQSPPRGVCKPDDLDKQIWDDWKRVRKKPVTPTVIKRIENEAAKIGWTLSQAITHAAENSWQGFKADWVDAPAKAAAPVKREPMTGQDWLAHCKRQLAVAEKFHGLYEIEQWRAKVADAERKLDNGRGGGQIGDLVENIMLDAQKDGG